MARALGVDLDEIRETVQRRPLESDVTTATMGDFAAAPRARCASRCRASSEECADRRRTRHQDPPSCATDWPMPPDGGAGAHRVIGEGRPRIEVSVEATDEGGSRAAGATRRPSDASWARSTGSSKPNRTVRRLDVPLRPTPALGFSATGPAAAGHWGQPEGSSNENRHSRGQGPVGYVVGRTGAPRSASRVQNCRWQSTRNPHWDCANSSRAAAIAQINGCIVCMDWRTDRDGEKVEDGFFEASRTGAQQMRSTIGPAWPPSTRSLVRARSPQPRRRVLGAMTEHYSQREIVELSMCIGSWIASGRLNHVLGPSTRCARCGTLTLVGPTR